MYAKEEDVALMEAANDYSIHFGCAYGGKHNHSLKLDEVMNH
jgi:hypothetical protein